MIYSSTIPMIHVDTHTTTIIILYYNVPLCISTLPYYTVLCCTVLYATVSHLYYNILDHTIPYHTLLILYDNAVLYSTAIYLTYAVLVVILYHTMIYLTYTILYTIPYYSTM